MALPVFTAAAAAPAVRALDFVNAGTQPVYAIRVGHHVTGAWSDDLLGPMDVVDVGDAQHVQVRLEAPAGTTSASSTATARPANSMTSICARLGVYS